MLESETSDSLIARIILSDEHACLCQRRVGTLHAEMMARCRHRSVPNTAMFPRNTLGKEILSCSKGQVGSSSCQFKDRYGQERRATPAASLLLARCKYATSHQNWLGTYPQLLFHQICFTDEFGCVISGPFRERSQIMWCRDADEQAQIQAKDTWASCCVSVID